MADNIEYLRQRGPVYHWAAEGGDSSVGVDEGSPVSVFDNDSHFRGDATRAYIIRNTGLVCRSVVSDHQGVYTAHLISVNYTLTKSYGATVPDGDGVLPALSTYSCTGQTFIIDMAINYRYLSVLTQGITNDKLYIFDIDTDGLTSPTIVNLTAGATGRIKMCHDRVFVASANSVLSYDMSGTLQDSVALPVADTVLDLWTNGRSVIATTDNVSVSADVYIWDKTLTNGYTTTVHSGSGDGSVAVAGAGSYFVFSDGATPSTLKGLVVYFDPGGVVHDSKPVSTVTLNTDNTRNDTIEVNTWRHMDCDGTLLYLKISGGLGVVSYKIDTLPAGDLLYDHETNLGTQLAIDGEIYFVGCCGSRLWLGLDTNSDDEALAYSTDLARVQHFYRAGPNSEFSFSGVFGRLLPIMP